MRVKLATVEHVLEVAAKMPEEQVFGKIDADRAKMYADGVALSFFNEEGECIAVFGAHAVWAGRWELWGLTYPEGMTGYGTDIVAMLNASIESLGPGRVEFTTLNEVRYNAFARALGFQKEVYRVRYFPDGRDAQAWVKLQ